MAGRELTLSIVIGTKDRPASLERCLRSILGQTKRPDEVIIIDDGRLDAATVLKSFEGTSVRARYFNKSHDRGLTKSRNLGIRESTGDVVMFLDDDVVLDERYVQSVLDIYERSPDVAAVGGRLLTGRLSLPKRAFLRFFLLDAPAEGRVLSNGIGVLVRHIREVTPVQWLSGCNMSFRRKVFAEFMFDEAFGGNGWGDDRDFSYRVGCRYPMVATPDALVHHLEEPAGRLGSEAFGHTEITYMHRFFVKNMPRRTVGRIAIAWSLVGITVKNCVTFRPRQVWGNLRGLAAVLRSEIGMDRPGATAK
jgi:glycosyltransferase involved in cell wall biosynthesis